MSKKTTYNKTAYVIELLTEEGINNPVNRSIIHLLQMEHSMLYSDLALSLGLKHLKFAVHINQLLSRNIINRDINNSRLSLNKQFIEG